MNRSIRSQEGFTLIELILVITLIGITAAIILPRGLQEGVNSTAIDSEAEKITVALRLARQKAMSTARPYRVEFDSDSYSLYEASSEPTVEDTETIDQHVQVNPSFGSGKERWVTFTASGTVEQTGTITLTGKNLSTPGKIIRVYSQGNVDIETP